MKGQPVIGYTVGNGVAINIELGYVPDLVQVWNLTDADEVHTAFLGGDRYVIPFTSGGTTEVTVGATIKGATSGATATVLQVLGYSGTWAGGDAAGFFIVSDVDGTFGSENVYVSSDTTSGTNDATVTVNVTHTVAIIDTGAGTTDISLTSSNDAISKYLGSEGSASKGFTIGSGIAEEAKLLGYAAWRSDV